MKKVLYAVLLLNFLLLSIETFGQDEEEIIDTRIKKDHSNTEWFTEMNAARPNYWKVKSSYDAFFTAHPNERSTEQKLCRRWMQMNASNIDARGYLLPGPTTELLKASFKIAARSTNKVSTNNILSTTASTFAGEQLGSWRMIGPFHAYKSKCSGTSSSLSGGYTDRVYINPYNTNNMYAGTSYGGLWVSQDAGNSWRLSDAEFPNATNTYANRDYYYGDIEAVKQNPQLVYAATEAGVLKSTNAGSSWNYCNELNRTVDPTLRPYFLAVAHDDTQTVLASFGRKIFRSTDAGATWTMVFDNSAGGSNKKFANVHSAQPFGISERTYNFFGLDFHPADANIVYIGMWNAANEPCIYKSTDRGATFSFLLNILQSTGRTAAYGTQGLEMLVVLAAPDKIFTRPYFSQDSIYHFDVNGTVLNRIKPGAPMEGFTINLRNENIVYTGYYGPSPNGSIVKKSTNAGLTFTDMTNGYGGCPKYVHPDIRGYAAVGDTVLVAHDGGLSRSFNGMTSIETIGYDISAVDLWGFSSSFKSDITVAGCDHGPTKVRRFDGDQGWRDIGGGDAGDCTVNPANDSLFYYNYNSSSTAAGKFIGVLNADNTISTTSMVNNDGDLNLMEIDPNLYTKIYNLKGTTVKVSAENGNNPVVFKDFGVNVTRFRIARKNARIMYVLLQNSIVQKSIDSGATWVNITPTTTQSNGRTVINDIEVGAQPDDVWLLYGQTQTDCKLLSTTDAGANWSNLTGILPAAAAKQFVYQRGTNAGLYVYLEGTAGVWYRSNNLSNWQQVGNGLPMMGYARNLYTVPAKNKFRMGSSRGAWEHELIETSGLDAQIAFDRSVCDRWSNIVKFRDFSAFNGAVTFEWSFPGGMPSTSTEEYPKVMYANPGVYSVTLTVRDANGNSSTQTLNNAITVINEGEAGLQPIADAYAWDGASSTNYGTVTPLVMKKDIGGTNRIPYFKFDLNNITEPVHSVRLQLFIQSASSASGTAPQWQLWKCTNDGWSETGITWSNRPSTSTLLATTTAKSSGMVEWDITSAVNAELAGDKILSLAVLPATNSTWYLNFHSRETATTLLRPQLMINQYPAITLTQPANGDVFDIGSSTTVKASVIDSISTPVVQFLINGNEAATIAQPPYEWNWNNMQPGSYGIRLRAENTAGFVAFSDSITVRVKDTSGMLEPIADSYVRDGSNATVNFGTQNVLVVKKDGSGFNRVTYLKFDLSGYTQVDTAKLKLTIQSGNTNAGVTQWQLWKCDNDNWTENGLNWNNKPVTTTLLGTVPGKRTGIAEWNISNAVQTEANGDKVLTLAVVSTVVNGTSDVNFHAREVTDATVRPKLIIEAPPVITLLQPTNNDTLIEKSTTLIKAKAIDDKKVANVSFFINGEQKAVIAQAPYEWSWTNTAPGNYGIRAKATDNSGISAWSDSVTVFVKDTTAPVITCPANIVAVYNPAVCGATINYNVHATDNFSTPVVTITNGLASGSVFPLGTTTVTAIATDAAGNTATCSFTVTVKAVTTTSSLNISTTNVQYSDKPTFTARITNGGSNCGSSAAATATFKLDAEVLATVPMQVNGNDLVAVYNDKAFTDAPGTNKTASVEFNTINEAFVVTNPSAINFSIVKEDAAAHYSGALFVSTAAANNGSATINLKATVRDITAETGNALYDAFEGDIRNATATFINRDNNTVIAANVPLVLATPGDTKTAIASYNWNIDIGSANSQSYTIGVIVNNFYTRNSSTDNAIITVSKPLDDFIAGGGNLLLANSSGIKAGDAGTLNDLGFSLKWNKSKSNLQGYLNTIIRRMENGVLHVYQVKANSMTSMVVDGSISATHPYPTASFGAKANIQDITDPLNPVAVDGNATLQVSMTDGSNYNAADKIGITVWNKNGSMWYSSNWTGVTAEQTLNAGDIVINSAAANNRVVMTMNDAAISNADNKLSVHAYPNPSGYEFKLDVQTNGEERIEVKVMDLHGRVIKVMQVSSGQSIQFGSTLKTGIYFVEVIQGKQKERIKLIKL
jgi:PKD repeat protein